MKLKTLITLAVLVPKIAAANPQPITWNNINTSHNLVRRTLVGNGLFINNSQHVNTGMTIRPSKRATIVLNGGMLVENTAYDNGTNNNVSIGATFGGKISINTEQGRPKLTVSIGQNKQIHQFGVPGAENFTASIGYQFGQ